MRNALTILLFGFVTIVCAQNGINYKAIVKDNSGNVVANDLIQVQFGILEGGTTVYEETHSPTTDANGLVVLNIGAGTPISGDYTTINWSADNHLLNVQVNTGGGLTDLGTTQFMTVPYAIQAENAITASNVTGLEALDEGNGSGWRLTGREPLNYGNIGLGAVDLSFGEFASNTFGAIGAYSIAMGGNTSASGLASTAMGANSVASGDFSTAIGSSATASGSLSMAIGRNISSFSVAEIAMGSFNTNYTPNSTTLWNSLDRLFVVGNGTSGTDLSDAFIILKNGTITAPSFDISEITDAKALITKEYADQNLTPTGLEATEFGWRLRGMDPDNYGFLGEDAVDLSINTFNSTTHGATGDRSFASGSTTTASGNSSTAMGIATKANRVGSTAIGFFSEANGDSSTALGRSTIAESYSETVVGMFSTPYTPNSQSAWVGLDRLFVVGNGTGDTNRSDAFTILKNGNVGVGTNTAIPNVRLDVIGDIEYTGTITDVSDRRLKDDLKPVKDVLAKLQQLQGYSYHMKEDVSKKREFGLIAQDLQKVFPEMVKTIDHEEKYLGISYVQLIPILIEAIKAQQKIIDTQNLEYKELATRILALEHKNSQP